MARVAGRECPVASGGSWRSAGVRRTDTLSCGSSLQDLGQSQEGTTRIWRREANRDTSSGTPECRHTLRSIPLGNLDPVIRLFEGNSLGSLRETAQESRISRRLSWPRTMVNSLADLGVGTLRSAITTADQGAASNS